MKKLFVTISAGLLLFILGVATAAHTQEPKEDEAKPAPHGEAHHGAAAPTPRQQAEPPRPETRPQAEPSRPVPHQQVEPPRPEARPQGEPSGRPPAPNSREEKPPARSQEVQRAPRTEEHPQVQPPRDEVRPPQPDHRAVAPQPAPAARPQPSPRPQPSAEPSRTPERREAAPDHAQQQDWDRARAENWQAEHRTWEQRGGYRGYRIPEDRYRVYFGQPHLFRIYQNPVMFVDGFPRFQYGGYWVQVVDPWPSFWAPDWFYTDDVYVDYWNGGYYLFDPRYPDYPLAVEIFQ